MGAQLAEIIRATLGELAFGERPDPFVRVQVGRGGREPFPMEARDSAAQLADGVARGDPPIVPENHHGTAEVTQQQPQERADIRMLKVRGLPAIGEAQPVADRAHRDAGDD